MCPSASYSFNWKLKLLVEVVEKSCMLIHSTVSTRVPTVPVVRYFIEAFRSARVLRLLAVCRSS